MAYAKHLVAFLAGMLFAAGLGVSGMLLPSTIHGFLDVTGRWNPALAFVMAAGCATYLCFDFLAKRRGRPLIAEKFTLPKPQPIDGRLIAGASLFGVGWGLAGVCPGPAITGALWNPSILTFTVAVFAGVAIFELGKSRLAHSPSQPAGPVAPSSPSTPEMVH